jgi:two-component system, chemotaxis family, chemotaxis protein CheY
MMARVLIVDDSEVVRQRLRVCLLDAGHQVLEAVHGREGLELACQHSVDLIIVDVNMPIMGGFEMVREVRKLSEHQSTPIFMLSSDAGALVGSYRKQNNISACLAKPFKPETLIRGVDQILMGR